MQCPIERGAEWSMVSIGKDAPWNKDGHEHKSIPTLQSTLSGENSKVRRKTHILEISD